MSTNTYSSKELKEIRNHIALHMGDAEYFMQMSLDNGLLVEVDIVRPTSYRNFYTLVTVGLGAYINENATQDGCSERCEITFFLPANWQKDSDAWTGDSWNWPIELLKQFVEHAVCEGVGLNSILNNGEPWGANTKQCAATLVEQVEEDMRVCKISNSDKVEFLSVFVLYQEEADYMHEHGQAALMQAVEDDLEIIQVAPFCATRKNIFNPNNKKYWLSHESQILSDWDDGPYCYASDSIMVDGKPIGYCYRVEPDESDSLGWDSGWRFFAADDGEDYRNNPANSGNFELNTLCNVDSLILPLLRAPFGSSFRRDEKGKFVFKALDKPHQRVLLTDEAKKQIVALKDGDNSANFMGMISYLREYIYKGVDKHLFSIDEARSNLEISLFYAYACINTDVYEQNFEASVLMPFAENYALGCGRWYYRYSCALTHCGQLKKALRYAEYGAVQEPGFPWIWLQLGKLRAHFGDKAGALMAVEKGLLLEPDNYEFMTLKREINHDASLEQMEFHVIDPQSDQQLQDGTLPSVDVKRRMIAGLVCDKNKLAQVKAMFQPMSDWTSDNPYCTFTWNITDEPLVVGFGMNEAALSKIDLAWLWTVREKLDGAHYRCFVDKKGVETRLVTVMIGWDQNIDLIYQYPNTDKVIKRELKL